MTASLSLAVPAGSLHQYIQAAHSVPMLSVEQERALAIQFREQNDLDAAMKLVLAHLRFVIHVARGYSGYGLSQEDLIQEGNIGLMKAVKRFNPEMGVRLVSFAVHWIRAEMHEFILRNWRIVKVATTKAQRKLFFNLRSAAKRQGWFSNDEIQHIARDLGVRAEDVREMEARLNGHDYAFDAHDDDADDGAYAPAAYLPDLRYDPATTLEQSDAEEDNITRLQQGLSRLDARSRDIMHRRWLNDDDKVTLQELADHYHISVERVRQLESAALKKLKSTLAA